MGLFDKKKPKNTAKKAVVKTEMVAVTYDLEIEKAACANALVELVGEQNAAEGFHFITAQCQNDPQFVKMIFDPEKRAQLMGIMSNLNPAQLLGGIASKFAHIL